MPNIGGTIRVAVTQSYDVIVGSNLLEQVSDFVSAQEITILADEHTQTYAQRLADAVQRSSRTPLLITVPAGERSKTLDTWGQVIQQLSDAKLSRQAALIAVGGGVVGDLGGFVAASYLRGIRLYHVPTTVLSMVDSSVGGKTGVNLPTGKNLVGAFWQPTAVFADVDVLATLPAKEFLSGTAELFKAGLIRDYELAATLLADWSQSAAPSIIADYLLRGIAVKAEIVAEDTFERGTRAFLNLGHTLAHALEGASGHAISHGVAVAYGLVFAAYLGKARGMFDYTDLAIQFLQWVGESIELPPFSQLVPYIERDKKAGPGYITYVLLEAAGQPVLVHDVTESEQRRAYASLQEVAL